MNKKIIIIIILIVAVLAGAGIGIYFTVQFVNEQRNQIEDLEDDNIDVFVELEDGTECVVVVSTPKNYYWYMKKEGLDYYCGSPNIIVRKLTEENIMRAISEYAREDAYSLKYYHSYRGVDIETLNRVLRGQEDIKRE